MIYIAISLGRINCYGQERRHRNMYIASIDYDGAYILVIIITACSSLVLFAKVD